MGPGHGQGVAADDGGDRAGRHAGPALRGRAPIDYPTGDGWPRLAERPGHRVWAYDSIEAARKDRDEQITRGYRTPEEIAEHIRDVTDLDQAT